MCTVTWWRGPDRYEVFFNRDERRTRAPAHPPRIHLCSHVQFLAAIDPVGGGSWLAVNERGVTAGLLNYYEREPAAMPAHPISRGLLLVTLMQCRSAQELAALAAGRACERYAPFLLLAFGPDGVRQVRWDGQRAEVLTLSDADRPVSTSSFDTARVLARRRACYAGQAGANPEPDELERFHFSEDPLGGPWSVCMTRDDARTVSFSRVRVASDQVSMDYQARDTDAAWATRISVALPRA